MNARRLALMIALSMSLVAAAFAGGPLKTVQINDHGGGTSGGTGGGSYAIIDADCISRALSLAKGKDYLMAKCHLSSEVAGCVADRKYNLPDEQLVEKCQQDEPNHSAAVKSGAC